MSRGVVVMQVEVSEALMVKWMVALAPDTAFYEEV